MTTSRLIALYRDPLRKVTSDNGGEIWFYKAQKTVNEVSQDDWSTDTASPDFSSTHGSAGSTSTGSTFSVSQSNTSETVGISVRGDAVTKSAPDNVKIIRSP